MQMPEWCWSSIRKPLDEIRSILSKHAFFSTAIAAHHRGVDVERLGCDSCV